MVTGMGITRSRIMPRNQLHRRVRTGAACGDPLFRRAVGLTLGRTHNPAMDIHSDNPEHGFQFPGTFELTAVGPAEGGLERVLPDLLTAAGIEVQSESIQWKHSSTGKFVSVRIGFCAASRAQYEQAHQVLREHPEVKWTL